MVNFDPFDICSTDTLSTSIGFDFYPNGTISHRHSRSGCGDDQADPREALESAGADQRGPFMGTVAENRPVQV